MPDTMKRTLRESQETFYCPSGHPQRYTQSEAERLRKQVAQLTSEKDQIQSSRDFWMKENDKSVKKINRLKKRAAGGVCPCCNRYFSALHKHMDSKHPGHAKPEPIAKEG